MKTKTTLLLTILTFHAFSSTMNNDLKGEIKRLLSSKYSLEDMALITFNPPHEEMSCTQSSFVSAIKIGYCVCPSKYCVIPSLVCGTIAAAGPAGPLAIPISLIVFSIAMSPENPSHECMDQANRYSNAVARHYLPDEYNQHLKMCEGIKADWEKKKAFEQFKKDKQKEEQKKIEGAWLKQFEEGYKKEQ